MKRLVLLLLLAGALAAGALLFQRVRPARAARPATGAGEPTAAEREAIGRALAALPRGTRVARDEDGTDTDSRGEMESLYASYHPYFVRGDLDGDGLLDFAEAFVVQRSGKLWFDVAVFFGRADGFSEPVFVERGISLADGDVAIERSLLVITPDLARDEARRWRWEPEERRFVDADATSSSDEPRDEDAPDETPDERPRVRV